MSDSRKRFEEWAKEFHYDLTRAGPEYADQPYVNEYTDWCWLAWSARDSEVERLREALNETLGALENLWLERIGSRDWFDQQTVVQSARSLLSSQDKESA